MAKMIVRPADLLRRTAETELHYCGTRSELIAAGLARRGDFPGDHPKAGRTRRIFERDGRKYQIRLASRTAPLPTFWEPPTYWLQIGKTSDQFHEHTAHVRAKVAEGLAEAEVTISKWPGNADQYRNKMAAALRAAVQLCVRPALTGNESAFLPDGTGGYRIDSESLREFDEAIEQAVAVLYTARAPLSEQKRRFAAASIRAQARKSDPDFQDFMRTINQTSYR